MAPWVDIWPTARAELLELRIERWRELVRQTREWINFAEIADWCARETGSIRRNDQLMVEAYRNLGDALASGEFEEGGRARRWRPSPL